MSAAIATMSKDRLADYVRESYADHARGVISDDELLLRDAAIVARREQLNTMSRDGLPVSAMRVRRPRRTPEDRRGRLSVRRRIAASGLLPPCILHRVTVGEAAVLSVMAGDIWRTGKCDACVDALEARSHTSRSVVVRARRIAVELGMFHAQERRVTGRKNLPTVFTIARGSALGRDLAGWLARRPSATTSSPRAIGCQNGSATDNLVRKKGRSSGKRVSAKPSSSRLPGSLEAWRLRLPRQTQKRLSGPP